MHTYTIRGHWPFPPDMLRHDGSRGATDDDQVMIDRLSGNSAPDRAAFKDVEIILAGPNKPNTARWESFGWAVSSDNEHAFFKQARETARKERQLIDCALSKLTPEERSAVCALMEGR